MVLMIMLIKSSAASATDLGIQKKIPVSEQTTKLIVSNDEIGTIL